MIANHSYLIFDSLFTACHKESLTTLRPFLDCFPSDRIGLSAQEHKFVEQQAYPGIFTESQTKSGIEKWYWG